MTVTAAADWLEYLLLHLPHAAKRLLQAEAQGLAVPAVLLLPQVMRHLQQHFP